MITPDTIAFLDLTPTQRRHRWSMPRLRSKSSGRFSHTPGQMIVEESNVHARPMMTSCTLLKVEGGRVRFADTRFAGLSNAKSTFVQPVVRADNGRLLCR
jgi:hypothetical protein